MELFEITAYKNFQFCFEDLKNGRRTKEQVPQEKAKELEKQYESKKVQQAIKLVTYFEEKFTCSGICESSLFYYTINLEKGPPTTTCLSYMKAEVANNLTYMGMTTLLCGFIMMFTWLCQYCLWGRYDWKAQ